jgi:malate dehydrogenase (oxaloacetate-decarboxylating)
VSETPEPISANEAFVIRTSLHGVDLLFNSRLNKGTAFTEQERDVFGLHGLLPPHIGTLEDQRLRRKRILDSRDSAFGKYSNMRDLQDNDETLFYSMIEHYTEELLPVVYTPAVGEGCQRFSEIWRRPRGLFISYPNRHRIDQILSDPRYDDVRCIVVSDGERILGLGDQGAGGMGIPIGKMALYTALGGIPPEHCLPILLDAGTDNEKLLHEPIYIGWQHNRVRGQEYDDFVEMFVQAVQKRWPKILLQWEDFAGSNAARLLERYRDRLCTFNDDIQGTAAVVVGTLYCALRAIGKRFAEQTVVILGAGGAGMGVAEYLHAAMVRDGLSNAEARRRFYLVDVDGLLLSGMTKLSEVQATFSQPESALAGWNRGPKGEIGLLEVMRNVSATVLIGVSAQRGAFTESVVREMARRTQRPIIFPLSNPSERAEAIPFDLLRWTDGRALVATGSPFPPVFFEGKKVQVGQCNNLFIFPAVGLAVSACGASRVTDAMMLAAARALGECSPAAEDPNACLLPPLEGLRGIAKHVATAVAIEAVRGGVAPVFSENELRRRVEEKFWVPKYRPYAREPRSA